MATTKVKKPGIYTITNIVSNRVYVGSSVNVDVRKSRHFLDLKNGTHANAILQKSFNKHGPQNFVFEVVECCETSNLLEREQFWIDKKKESCVLYNLSPTASSQLGIRRSEETKRRMSEAKKGRRFSQQTIEKMRIAKIGTSYRKGKKASDETRKRISEAKKGTIVSDETRALLSAIRKGNKNACGHKQSEETVRKRVESSRLTRERKKLEAAK